MNFDDYKRLPLMNASTLVNGLHSMRRLKRIIDQDKPETSEVKELGTAIHALLLEPDEFENHYCVMPDYHLDEANVTAKGVRSESKATTYYAAKVEEFTASLGDKRILTREQYDRCLMSIESLRAHHSASRYLVGRKECTLLGTICGEPFKGRLDVCGNGFIADLKTCTDASPHRFGRVAANFGYDFKLAIYRDLYSQNFGSVPDVFIVAQETAGDYDTCVIHVPNIALDNALDDVHRVIRSYQRCKEIDVWPGVDGGESYVDLVVPNWRMRDDDIEVFNG